MDIEKRIERSLEVIDRVVNIHDVSKIFTLFSGGHDSLVSTDISSKHPKFHSVVHINTGIGIPETRKFVRKTCDENGWNLIELEPDDKTYEELVMEKGFPRGPKSHNSMYYYLKQRQIQRLIRKNKDHYYDKIGLVTGIRKKESGRRMATNIASFMRKHGAQIWINPILYWSKLELSKYIDQKDNILRNEVVDKLHKSGECLCGALASRREIEEIEFWYPETARKIRKLENKCAKKGLIDCKWAVSNAPGKTWDDVEEYNMELCSSCSLVYDD